MNGQGADEMRIAQLLRIRGIGPDAPVQPQPDAVTAAAAAANAHSDAAQPQPQPPVPTKDWWDALYADDHAPTAAQPDTDAADAGAAKQAPSPRIPPWWSGRHVDTSPPAPAADEQEDADASEDDEDQDDEPESLDDDSDELDDEAQPRTPAAPAPRRTGSRRSHRGPVRRSPTAPRALIDTPAAPRRSLLDAAASVEPRIRWLILHSSAAAAGYVFGWVDWSTRTSAWIREHGWMNPSAIFWCVLAFGCEVLRYKARTTRLPIRWAAAIPIASIVAGAALYGVGWQTLDLGV